MPLLLLAGCTAEDATGIKIDLSQINWQTGVIAALLLWVDKSSIWAPIGKFGQPIVDILRQIGLLKKSATPDATPDTLTSAEALAIIVDLINRTQNADLREHLLQAVPTAAGPAPGVAADGK